MPDKCPEEGRGDDIYIVGLELALQLPVNQCQLEFFLNQPLSIL